MVGNDVIERVRRIIHANRYLTLATTDSVSPWLAPLAYVVEDDYSFIYYSAVDALHSIQIEKNNRVACTIFDSQASSDEADGVQFSADVSEVSELERQLVLENYFLQSFPNPEVRRRWLRPIEDFAPPAAQRFYRIVPREMFALDVTSIKVDRRIKVDLDALRGAPR